MHTYGQYCGLAKALDVVGGRWSLLIVRELLIRGACRYTDLRKGLPGIATNMLADRLRELEEVGVVKSEMAPPPVATTLFRLTPRGKELEPILMQLGMWGAPLLATSPKSDTLCSHWMSLPMRHFLEDRAPDGPPVEIELRCGDELLTIEAREGEVQVRPGSARHPNLVLAGAPRTMLGLLMGHIDWPAARAAGLKHEGDLKILQRVRAAKAA